MSLLSRVRDLVSANLNAMLDKAEDPEKMVNEYMRQLQEQLYEAKTAVASAMADETKLHNKMVTFQTEADQWQSKAEAAVRASDDELAKAALGRKANAQKMADTYRQQYEQQDEQVEQLQKALVSLESRLSEAKAKKELIIAKKNRAETQEAIQRTVQGLGNLNAMDKLSQMEERVDDRLAQADAMSKLEGSSLETRFADLERDTAVEDELAALKAKMGKQ
ncbi:MAG TPA: phage shock protein A [Herpetosiphon sp.]|uniref:Phage shock protein A, PspA n=2 Tax=Herpetosiphon TaxID=64 RepID=A9B6C8_HERA2|nr:PspA/IM30 family protein [Herpetosiphon sp.]ABX02831.1 phage shock protein A, PspA [Herpetosiphon aurantiacus DSM 785]HBW49707.1 phage shock protein A [Herpetosiphon sp.]